jgi:hypothetical protein
MQFRLCTLALSIAATSMTSNPLRAESKTLRKGPPSKVEKSIDDHLIQVYVTPPKADGKYAPGRIRVFLRREFPDYLYVPLATETMKDGRLHVQIAISPKKQGTYSITVLDEQPKEILISYWKKLSEIKVTKHLRSVRKR